MHFTSRSSRFSGLFLAFAAAVAAGACSPDPSTPTTKTVAVAPTRLDGITLEAGKSYRVAVVFTQFDDDFAEPTPEVGADIPYTAGATLDFGAIRVPAGDKLLLCKRPTLRDAPVPPCDADTPFAFALGTIVVVEDANKNGVADTFTVGSDGVPKEGADPIVGFVQGGVIYSPKGGDKLPLNDSGAPILIDGTVPAGATLYESYAPPQGFHRLRLPAAGTVFTVTPKGPNWT
jgi:hypothetical protein